MGHKTAGYKRSVQARAELMLRGFPKDAVVVWCDGARSREGWTGAGCFVQYPEGGEWHISEPLGHGTNQTAELWAVRIALERLLAKHHSQPVRIVTDSSYVVGLLMEGWNAKANVELVAKTREALFEYDDCEVLHIPGHCGVPGNEQADLLATTAKEEAVEEARRGAG